MLSAAKEKDFSLNRLVNIKDSTLLPKVKGNGTLIKSEKADQAKAKSFNPGFMVWLDQRSSDLIASGHLLLAASY